MIADQLKNAYIYYKLNDKVAIALKYLEKNNLLEMESGKYTIDDDNIFAIIQDYESKPEDQGRWEAHRQYIDIQYVIKGQEKIGYAPVDNLEVTENYDEEKDILFLKGDGCFLKAVPGTFMIFTPKDAHMPGIAVEKPDPVKKIVVKIKV